MRFVEAPIYVFVAFAMIRNAAARPQEGTRRSWGRFILAFSSIFFPRIKSRIGCIIKARSSRRLTLTHEAGHDGTCPDANVLGRLPATTQVEGQLFRFSWGAHYWPRSDSNFIIIE